jgi:hypothetical protein
MRILIRFDLPKGKDKFHWWRLDIDPKGGANLRRGKGIRSWGCQSGQKRMTVITLEKKCVTRLIFKNVSPHHSDSDGIFFSSSDGVFMGGR